MEKQKCFKCNKAMPSIGKNRVNGKNFVSGANYNKDWKKRRYHKKCWKQYQLDFEWEYRLKQLQLEKLEKENKLMKEIITNNDNEKEKLNTKIENDKFIVRFK